MGELSEQRSTYAAEQLARFGLADQRILRVIASGVRGRAPSVERYHVGGLYEQGIAIPWPYYLAMASTTFEVYAETAPAPRMRAIAKIALARGVSQTSAAAKLGLHSSNVRRHFESKAVRSSTVDAYIELLARNELDRNLMREYLDILDGRFDVQSAREAVINDLRARELNLREGALSDLLAAIEAIADTTLLPALQAYLQTNREWRLSLVASPFMLSFVGRKLGLAFEVFAGAINEHVDVEAFLSPERTPAEDCLWLLWAHTHIPDSPFTDDDREAIIDLAAGRLLRRGIDAVPMLRYVDRLREHTARKVALTEASIAQSKASSTKGGRLSERQTTAAKGTQER